MARLIGDAYIVIYPQGDNFGPRAEAIVKKALAALKPQVPVSPVLDKAAAAKARAEMKSAFSKVQVPVDAELSASSVASIKAQLDALTSRVNLGLAIDPAELAKVEAELRAIAGDIPLKLGISPAQVAAAKALISNAFRAGAGVPIRAAIDPASLTAAAASVKSFFGSSAAEIPLKVGVNPATLAAVKAATSAYFSQAGVMLSLNTMPAMAKVTALAAYAKEAMSNAVSLNWAAPIAQALTLQAAVSSLGDTFYKMSRNAQASAAIVDAGVKTLWASFIDMTTAGGGAFGFLNARITLFAGAFNSILPAVLSSVSVWHLAADWVVEFGAVFVPATLAVTAFGLAIAPVVSDAVLRLQSMQQAAAALGVSIGKLDYNASGAVGPMQALQNQLQPVVWELTGDAITVMTAKTGVFSTVVRQVSTVVEDLAARMTAAFTSSSATDFMKNGALDFQRFGTIIGNLGGAFGNFIKAVPGYAEIIQELFVKITAGIEAFTAVTIPIMHAALALHGFIIYVGLAATAGVALIAGVGNIIAKFFAFGAATTDLDAVLLRMMYTWDALSASVALFADNMGKLLLNPYVLAIAALGLAAYALVTNFNSASTSVQNFISKVTAIGNMAGGDALQSIPQALGQISQQMKIAASPAAYQQLAANWNNLSNTGNAFAKDSEENLKQWGAAISSLGHIDSGGLLSTLGKIGTAIKGMFVPGEGIGIQVADNIKALQAAFNQLSGQEQNLLTVTAQLMQGQVKGSSASFTWAQSLGILDAAGVQASDSLQMMEIKVQGFLAGWAQFGLNASQIGNSVNALALQSEMGQSAISKLTGAYSNFIGVVTGGETAFSTFGTGLSTLQQALSQTGAKGIAFSDSLGKFTVRGTAAGATMNGLSQASLNVRNAFAAEITNATGLYNSLLTMSSVSAAGAKGQQLLSQAGKDMVATLLPLAKGSQSAMAEVSALAQLAGGPATTSFQQLAQWTGNVKNPMQQLNKIEQQLTISSSNLLQDTQNLAGAMNQTLTSAISGAIFAAEKGPQALENLATALNNLATHKGDVTGVEQALQQSIPALVEMSGSGKLAEDQFIAMAGALHISAQQATAMWNAVLPASKSVQQLAQQSLALTNATNANGMAFKSIPGALANSTDNYNLLWAAIAKGNTQLVAGKGYVDTAKTAFISFAENGLGFTAAAASRLWAANNSQNLVSLAGKASTTQGAFVALAKNGLGLTTSQAQTLWNELRLQYLDTLVAKGKGAESQFISLAKSGLDLTTTSATQLWNTLKNQYLDTLAAKAGTTAGAFANVAKQFGISNQAAVILWASLKNLPPNVRVAIDETIAGGGSIKVQGDVVTNASTGIATSTVTGEQTFNGYAYASGGTVRGSGPSGRDSVLIGAAPGELVIPTSHAPKFADMARKASIPGFAAGGVIGQADTVAGMNAAILPSASKTSATIVGMAGEALVSAMASALQAVAAASAQIGMAGVSNASSLAALESAAAKAGWTGAQWTALFNVEMREAGFSTTATNPSSGAYGMAQFINGPSEYALYGGNSTTAAGQAVAMVNYIKCLQLTAKILTRNGWKTYAEVQVGDETIGYDHATGRSAWTKVTAVHYYEDAPVTRLYSNRVDLRSTPNHRWLTEKLIQRPEGNFRREEFTETQHIGTRHRIRLAAPADQLEGLPLSLAEAELLGWVAGDGHTVHPTPSSVFTSVFQSEAKPKQLAQLRVLLDGIPHSEYTRPSVDGRAPIHQFRLRSPYTRDLFSRSGYEDSLEQMVLLMSSDQRAAFTAGLLEADGYLGPDGVWTFCQNEGPVLRAFMLAAYLGGSWCHPTASAGQVHVRLGSPYVGGGSTAHGNTGGFHREELERQPVWCVTTELGSWTVEQDGQVFLTGNSRYGNPEAAWLHEQQFGWYNQGGVVPGGKGYSAGGMISEPVFGYGKFSGMPYSFAENGPEQVIPGGAANAQNQQLPGMTTFQANTLIGLMQQNNKLMAQLPYAYAQALQQANAAGVRRGYFATSG